MRGIWNPDDKGTVLCGLVTIAMENQGKRSWGKGVVDCPGYSRGTVGFGAYMRII